MYGKNVLLDTQRNCTFRIHLELVVVEVSTDINYIGVSSSRVYLPGGDIRHVPGLLV